MKFNNNQKIAPYLSVMRLNQRIGIYLLLWPVLWALWIAEQGPPRLELLIIFCLGTIFMRTAGCIVNDFFDMNYDGKVTRTLNRPLVTGELSPIALLPVLICLLSLCFFLVLLTNKLTIFLAMVGLVLAISYPLVKRFSYLPQLYLGVAFGWGILLAFAATLEKIPIQAWMLFLSNVMWIVSYDTQYAMCDRDDDINAGIKSTAILFGKDDVLIIIFFQLFFLILLGWTGIYLNLNLPYFVGLMVTLPLFYYQWFLIKNRKPENCLVAFRNNNFIGAIIFCSIAMSYHIGTI